MRNGTSGVAANDSVISMGPRSEAPGEEFIRVWSLEYRREVEFVIEQIHDLDTGVCTDLDP
jgi:hypothetical protein